MSLKLVRNGGYKLNLRKKELKFSTLCGDWDYRNIDMTEPHLSEINIGSNKIIATYEKYSSALDDYVFCIVRLLIIVN